MPPRGSRGGVEYFRCQRAGWDAMAAAHERLFWESGRRDLIRRFVPSKKSPNFSNCLRDQSFNKGHHGRRLGIRGLCHRSPLVPWQLRILQFNAVLFVSWRHICHVLRLHPEIVNVLHRLILSSRCITGLPSRSAAEVERSVDCAIRQFQSQFQGVKAEPNGNPSWKRLQRLCDRW